MSINTGISVAVADDSPNIQKVVQIILGPNGYNLLEYTSEEELRNNLKKDSPNLLFLDFGLSSHIDGYQLAEEVLKLSPMTEIIMLYGTFDTLEEDKLTRSGVKNHLFKPFDADRLVGMCRAVLDQTAGSPSGDFVMDEAPAGNLPPVIDAGVANVDLTSGPGLPSVIGTETSGESIMDDIESTQKWNVTVPRRIGEKELESLEPSIPEIIGDSQSELDFAENDIENTEDEIEDEIDEEIALPGQSDLEYPDLESLSPKVDDEISVKASSTQLTSTRDLNLDELDLTQTEREDRTEVFQMSDVIERDQEKTVTSLREQIEDEVDEDSWRSDEADVLTGKIEKRNEPTHGAFHLNLEAERSLEDRIWSRVEAELEQKMDSMISRLVSEKFEIFAKQRINKELWEILPELAENIVRSEIRELRNSVESS